MNQKIKKTLVIFILAAILSWGSKTASAAFIYFEPSARELRTGDIFGVNLHVNNDPGECVNVFSIQVSYPPNLLRAMDFHTGESIITLWTSNPQIDQDNGRITFAGGLPGGYCGKVPGDPGPSNILGRIFFTVNPEIKSFPQLARLQILSDSEIYLNDGFGTQDKWQAKTAEFTIQARDPSLPIRNDLLTALKEDTVPPENFVISLGQDPSVAGGKYYLIFSTTDKQSGLDRFEVIEKKQKPGPQMQDQNINWVTAKSPYILQDQSLQSIVLVKAVDKAGNERIVEFSIPEEFIRREKEKTLQQKLILALTATLILGAAGLFVYIWRKRRKGERTEV
jgi:hypothetical protein